MNRRGVEKRLASIVRENRRTIAFTVPIVGVILLISGREGLVPEWIAFHPYLMVAAVLVMALPLIAGLAPIVDRRALLGLGILVLFTWGIELTGVRTGFPYGEFAYQLNLGPMLFGDIPLALPVFYFPILLNGYLLAVLMLGERSNRLLVRYPVVVGLVVTLDLILDPGAVSLGFWAWDDPGIYYDVPIMNFLGWVLSGSVAVGLIHLSFDHADIKQRLSDCEFLLDDLINFVIFWGLVNVYFYNVIPAALGLAVLAFLFRADWFDFVGLGASSQSAQR